MKFDTGRNERGDRTYVIIDANNRHWDYEPDSVLSFRGLVFTLFRHLNYG
jgi:hypothetical protein